MYAFTKALCCPHGIFKVYRMFMTSEMERCISLYDKSKADVLYKHGIKLSSCRTNCSVHVHENYNEIHRYACRVKFCKTCYRDQLFGKVPEYLTALEYFQCKTSSLYFVTLTIPNEKCLVVSQKKLRDRFLSFNRHFSKQDNIEWGLGKLECPLTEEGDWNPHYHLLISCKEGVSFGKLFKEIRKEWGIDSHCHYKSLNTDVETVTDYLE